MYFCCNGVKIICCQKGRQFIQSNPDPYQSNTAIEIFWQAAFWLKRSKAFEIRGWKSVWVMLSCSFNKYQKYNWMRHHSLWAWSPVISYHLHHSHQMQMPCTQYVGKLFYLEWKDYINEMSRYRLLSGAEVVVWMGTKLVFQSLDTSLVLWIKYRTTRNWKCSWVQNFEPDPNGPMQSQPESTWIN